MAGFPNFFRLTKSAIRHNPDACDFTILTTLASPRIEHIKTLTSGSMLSIIHNEGKLEAVTKQGEVCGNVIGSVEQLKSCLNKGVIFEGKVLLVNGAECQLFIQKAKTLQ